MPYWCQQHGEGKKWHLNAKDFSRDFSQDKTMIEALNAYFQNIYSFVGTSLPMNVEQLSLKNDNQFSEMTKAAKQWFSTLTRARNSGRYCSMLDWHSASSSFKEDTGWPCS